QVTEGRERIVADAARIAASAGMCVVLPTYELHGDRVRNSAVILDRTGAEVGRYAKVHVTEKEKQDYGVVPGGEYPTFDLDFGRAGVMICYDGHFPEVAGILALAGADIIFFPSLQRGYGEQNIEVQVRARALDNAVHVVRSSYGVPAGQPWTPGKVAGLSCIVNDGGRIIANCGRHEGYAIADVDLDRPRIAERSHGGQVGEARRFLVQDRRPDTYGALTLNAPEGGR
ncbi:MAG: carbon-nitrogen hydrolase family protein, partial [Armatimonadota bacterium]